LYTLHYVHQFPDIEINQASPAFSPGYYGPEAYSVSSVDLLPLTHSLYVGSITIDNNSPIVHVPPHLPAKVRDPPDPSPSDDIAFVPGLDSNTSFGPSSAAPYTKSYVNANLPGGIFEKTPLSVLPSPCQVLVYLLAAERPAPLPRIPLKPKWMLPIN
jgi:hypothetical protein